MGLLSTTRTYVSSTAYNLAGDEADRPNFLKTLVVGGIVGESRSSIGQTIQKGYMDGPGMRLRKYMRWADRNDSENYDQVGVPRGSFGGQVEADAAVIQDQIPRPAGKTPRVTRVEVGQLNHYFWATQRMLEFHPSEILMEWFSDVDEVTGTITLYMSSGSIGGTPTAFDSFTPVLNKSAQYIYAFYVLRDDATGLYGPARLFIYEIGSGNAALDALGTDAGQVDDDKYVPFIPIRDNNVFLSPTHKPLAYEQAKRAYRKATNSSFDELVEKIADNPDLGDIDYAYIVFGVSLNTFERASREYLFRFFDRCRTNQYWTLEDYNSYSSQLIQFEQTAEIWNTWAVANNVSEGRPNDDPPPPPEPNYENPPPVKASEVRIRGAGFQDMNLNMTISWGAIEKTTGTGLKKPDAKAGDVWLEVLPAGGVSRDLIVYTGGMTVSGSVDEVGKPVRIHWQKTDDYWETLEIHELRHKNLIYKKKSVDITGSEALEDTDISGFIVPLHYGLLREMSLVDTTQMMTAAAYIVFNSYKIVKLKWYQTFIFKIFVFAVSIALTMLTGVGGTISSGLLGSSATIGAQLGLTGLAAILTGNIVNAVAAIVVTKLIAWASVQILGEKWGQLVGAVLSTVALSIGTGLANGANIGAIFNSMTSAVSLINLTMAVGSGIAGYTAASAAEYVRKAERLREESDAQLKSLSERFAQEFGYDRGVLNPMGLTDTPFGNFVETEEVFLTRTLLTGSDIAEMTHDMVTNYTAYMLRLDLRPVG